jgi:hypothetical protein
MEKDEAKERARFVSSAMLRLWRAECRRCIGSGVGVHVHVHAGRADDLFLPASSLHHASTIGHSNGSSNGHSSSSSRSSSSSSGSSSKKHPSPRGGYEVLGRTLAEWEAFVLEGSETQKR